MIFFSLSVSFPIPADSHQSFPWFAAGVALLGVGYLTFQSLTAPVPCRLPGGGSGSGPVLVGPDSVREQYRIPYRRFPVKIRRVENSGGSGSGGGGGCGADGPHFVNGGVTE